MDYIGNARGRFFRSQTHLRRILSQNGAQVVILKFFDMLSESVRGICMTSPELLANLEIAEFCDWTRKQFSCLTTDQDIEKINYCYSTVTQLIKRKLQFIVIKIPLYLNVLL